VYVMKAAVLDSVDGHLHVEDIEIDSPQPREVLIRTGASGVCHSDLHFAEGKYNVRMPVVLGHEASGVVEEVGSQVSYVKPGDRVVTCLSTFCGHCDKCLSGRPALCNRVGVVRAKGDPPRLSQGNNPITQFSFIASFAEKMLVHEHSLVKIGDDIPMVELALMGCGVITGLGAVFNTAKVKPGSTVAVIGCGGVGLNSVQGASLVGALRIIAIDNSETKLQMAREFGATDVINASLGGVVEKVKELTGRGVDYSFEAIGVKETAEQAFGMLDTGGVATIIGMIPIGTKIELEGSSFLGERRIQGSGMGSNRFRIDIPRYLGLYRQGRLRLSELISRQVSLSEINNAFTEIRKGLIARSVIVFD